ncbi:hypothetical protein Q7C36_005597 [Tachysurus vachellii]|uniref:Uncharacterized protein n=1 Tax=Tachysurus vachellii TaxID=175792 RepID=A0AA88NHW8_TACVA|nr:hypothetical protein Q7C36_005597 [Tachysurus vachellii]
MCRAWRRRTPLSSLLCQQKDADCPRPIRALCKPVTFFHTKLIKPLLLGFTPNILSICVPNTCTSRDRISSSSSLSVTQSKGGAVTNYPPSST